MTNQKGVIAKVGSILVLLLLWHSPLVMSQSVEEVTVKSTAANIRSGPSTNNSPLLRAEQGTRFSVVRRVGAWYEIEIPRSAGVNATRGFIHRSTVDIGSVPSIGPEASRPAAGPAAEEPLPPEDFGPSYEVDAFELQRRWTDRQWREYERHKKHEFAAAGLEVLVPLLGYAYVHQAKDGLKPALISVGGLTAGVLGGLFVDDRETAATLYLGGMLVYAGGRIWGIVSALDYAEEYNRELIRRIASKNPGYRFGVLPTEHGQLLLTVRFSH